MTVTDLTRSVEAYRTGPRHERYSLLLGKACAREAGKPYQQVIRKLVLQLKSYIQSDAVNAESIGASLAAIPMDDAPDAENLPAKLLTMIPDSLRAPIEQTMYRLLRQYYVELPVPLFYQDLASLLKSGVFSRVLTTNYDNLLEQALGSAPSPLRRDQDYFVVNVPALNRTDLKQRLASFHEDGLLILKLHGDLMQEGGDFDLPAIESKLREHRKTLYGELSEDILVVGYERESVGVDKALRAQSGGAIWWVNENGLDPELSDIASIRTINVVTGPCATPQEVFGAMLTIISRAPDSVSKPSAVSADGSVESAPAESELSAADLGTAILSDRLARAQDELERLRQSAPPRSNPDVEAQIDYQERQISEIEDHVRLGKKDKILDVLGKLSFSQADPELLQFVDTNKKLVADEFQKTTPNQHLISAALSAIAVTARRLGDAAAPADAVQALNAFLPSALGRGA